MEFPKDDADFDECTIKSVRAESGGGWTITRDDGWSYFVPKDAPVKPEPGMRVRFYPHSRGGQVRGLFLDGKRVFYRTEAEHREWWEREMYGEDASDWLRRWDAGRTVWSIEMGGLGPGYEQAIQIVAAQLLRHMLNVGYRTENWHDEGGGFKAAHRDIEAFAFKDETIRKLGISGAQFGAALRLAVSFYEEGPRATLTRPAIKDRLIQVQRTFPTI